MKIFPGRLKIKNKNLVIGIIVSVLIVGIVVGSYFMFFYNPYKFRGDGPIKIFWVNSYTPDFYVSNESFFGFEKVLRKEGMNYEVQSFDMDTLDVNSEDILGEKGREAKRMIDEYNPDLIYATEDNAQRFVIVPYYLNGDIPVVFSGVNLPPEDYDYEKAKNVAGVLEREHFVETIELLTLLKPDVKKIAVIFNDFSQWLYLIERMQKESRTELKDIEFIGWHMVSSWEDYKNAVLNYQDKADALVIGFTEDLKDEKGNEVSLAEIEKWRVENNHLPDVSFWRFRVEEGVLASVEISFFEQGEFAAKHAKSILIDGVLPSNIPFSSTKKSQRVINLKRAESLGMKREEISGSLLINSKVYEDYSWEEENDI